MTSFNNETDMDFTDISSERERVYTFPTGKTYQIDHPEQLHVSSSGGHRIFDGTHSHYIQPKEGWAIRWRVKEGFPNFVT